LRRIKLLWRS